MTSRFVWLRPHCKTIVRFIVCAALMDSTLFAEEKLGREIAVYFPDYRYKGGTKPDFRGTTNLILFSAKPRLDGTVDFDRLKPNLIKMGKTARIDSGMKVTFCVGGWGRGKLFATAVSTPGHRETFIAELLNFCTQHDLDGVDIDWEFPKGEDEHAHFTLFLKGLSEQLHARKKILTVALGYTRPLDREAYAAIDFVNLMSYQPWRAEPYEAWLEKAVHRFLESGLPPEKLNIGLGFFTKELGGDRRAISWSKLADSDGKKLPPTDYGFSPVGKTNCDLRFQLIEKYQLGGLMIWDYGHDSLDPDKSLLKYISEKMNIEH